MAPCPGWVDVVRPIQGGAVREAASLAGGYLMHAGMNILDKHRLFREAARVLRRGARFAVYDVMRTAEGDLAYPLPWASSADQSNLATPGGYRNALTAAGFAECGEFDHRATALDYFGKQQAAAREGLAAPPLGLHLLMGDRRQAQIRHMLDAIQRGVISPVLMIVERQ